MAGHGSSARLLQLPYSPWSEKSRWALDFHEIPCADAHSHRADRARLIPDADHDRIERYNALSERGLAGGRWRSLRRMLDSPAALRDMVPRNLRTGIRRSALDPPADERGHPKVVS
jgi:hypothetical protein